LFRYLFGIISALHKDTWIDRLIALVSTGMSIPSSAILFAWLFGFVLHKYTNPEHMGSLYEVDDFGEGSYIQWKTSFYPQCFRNTSAGGGNPTDA
jgi:peptide/nickel transport system permease protein